MTIHEVFSEGFSPEFGGCVLFAVGAMDSGDCGRSRSLRLAGLRGAGVYRDKPRAAGRGLQFGGMRGFQ